MAKKERKDSQSFNEELIEKAKKLGVSTCLTRAKEIKPCSIGVTGACCSLCYMGPCRLAGGEAQGVCGATIDTITSRNFARSVAAGAAAHSDHARDLVFTLLAVALGKIPGIKIKDEEKLRKVALDWGIKVESKTTLELAKEVAQIALDQFSLKNKELNFLSRAPRKRQDCWKKQALSPRGIDWEVAETLNRTHEGTDQEAESILNQALRTALADGWGGSMLATEISDILFGTPKAALSRINLGVIKEDEVNIVVHGHNPLVAEAILQVANENEFKKTALERGAKGINLIGICCTANEILMRHGIPSAGNFLHQELTILTGAVDLMVVDVQCIMQALAEVAKKFHTKLVTTSSKTRIPGAIHIEFNPEDCLKKAREVVELAIENFPRRLKVNIPSKETPLVTGFSHEYINFMLGGKYLASLRELNNSIIDGRLQGVVAVIGCNNPRVGLNEGHRYVVKELIRNNVVVFQTGCGALTNAQYGFLLPEAMEEAGPILKVICKSVGIPPVLHLGSCVNNSRLLTIFSQMVKDGGLGNDISTLPVAGICPEWKSEKALSIGTYLAASGVYVLFGVGSPVGASCKVVELMSKGWERKIGGKLEFEPNYQKIIQKVLEHLKEKRKALGLGPERDREVHDIERRRALLWWRNQLKGWQ